MFFPQFNTYALGYLIIAMLSLIVDSAGADTHTSPKIQEHNGLKLYVLDCGRILARDASLFNPLIPKGMEMTMADPCYLIQHKQQTLLWDAGLSDELINSKTGADVMGGAFHMSVNKTLASQLQVIGIKPASIDYLAFSHLHLDHTGNVKLIKNAVWLMQEAEYRVAYGPDVAKYGYRRRYPGAAGRQRSAGIR